MTSAALVNTVLATLAPSEEAKLPPLQEKPAIVAPAERTLPPTPSRPWTPGFSPASSGHGGFLVRSPFLSPSSNPPMVINEQPTTLQDAIARVMSSDGSVTTTAPESSRTQRLWKVPSLNPSSFGDSELTAPLSKAALVNAEFEPRQDEKELDEGRRNLMETIQKSRKELCMDRIPKSDARDKLEKAFDASLKALPKDAPLEISKLYKEVTKELDEILKNQKFGEKDRKDLERQSTDIKAMAGRLDKEFGKKE